MEVYVRLMLHDTIQYNIFACAQKLTWAGHRHEKNKEN